MCLLFLQQSQFLPVGISERCSASLGSTVYMPQPERPRVPCCGIPKAEGKASVPRCGGGHGGKREQWKLGGKSVPERE